MIKAGQIWKSYRGNTVEITAIAINIVYFNQSQGEKGICSISQFEYWIKENEAQLDSQ